MSECLVEASDVVRLLLQFLKETSLTRTLQTLQNESHVALNTVDNVDAFITDVQQGNWESVLTVVATLRLPSPLLVDLYEQLILELVEVRELDTARLVLRGAKPMVLMRTRDDARFAKLMDLIDKPFDARDAYAGGDSKKHRRAQLAEALRAHVTAVPPSRLLALLGQALKWQQQQGQLPVGQKFDLFTGGVAAQRALQVETYVEAAGPVIKFGKKSHAECAAFSPDGLYLVSGSVDGFLEVCAHMHMASTCPDAPNGLQAQL